MDETERMGCRYISILMYAWSSTELPLPVMLAYWLAGSWM